MADLLLALMLLTTPGVPRARLEAVAHAVAAATPDPHEQRLLLAADWGETGYGRAGRRFGVMGRRRSSLDAAAAAALTILRRAATECGVAPGSERVWLYYNTGRCNPPRVFRRRVRHHTARVPNPAYAYARAMIARVRRLENR